MAASVRRRVHPQKWPGVYMLATQDNDVIYYVTFKDDEGKKRWEKVGRKSEGCGPEVCAEVRAQRLSAMRHHREVHTAQSRRRKRGGLDRTLSEIKDAYFDSDRGRSLMGRNTDLNRWKNYLAPALGGRRVSTLTETDVQQLKTEMGGNAPATVRNTLELLRRLCNYGARLNLCPRLSFVIQMPKLENERIEFLDPDQLRRLIETLDGWPSQDVARMLKLAMLTGMRRGEIFRLKDSHIDRLHRLITIEESKGETTASIPISDAVMALLEEQLAWRDAKYAGSHYVFPGRKGEKRVDSTAVDRIKARAGLPKDFRIFHGLRHHFAVTLANSGMVDLSTIQGLLTHKSPEMTRRYGRFMPETRQRAANLAAELIRHKAQGNDHQPGKK